MALQPDQKIAHYRVIEKIGEGGMGEVYRAEDTKLGRSVALKILPEQFVQDETRLTRFSREAQLLASLNHPNIAAIHGLEEADGITALALELVEGETLAERVGRGRIPIEEAAPIALQIAEALETAHEKGIIHRDLKPANIMFAADGRVKVLDFGLAKALDDGSHTDMTQSPTLSVQATQAGVILGTAAYMSPEQAAGKQVDRRADIWAFGVVLAEMLTGRRTFQGESVSYVLAAVLKDEPDLDSLPVSVPNRIKRLLRRCLHKDPKQRLQAIGDARIELGEYLADPAAFAALDSSPGEAADILAAESRSRRNMHLSWAVATILFVVLAAVSVWMLPPRQTVAGSSRSPRWLALDLTADATVRNAAISPDGNRIAYVVETGRLDVSQELWLYSLEDGTKKRLDHGPGADVAGPFFSPDGRWIAFHTLLEIRKVAVTGGPSLLVCKKETPNTSAVWLADDTIVFNEWGTFDIRRVPAAGGDIVTVSSPRQDQGEAGHWPVSRGPEKGQVLMAVNLLTDRGRGNLEILDVDTGERRIVRANVGIRGRAFIAAGRLLWVENGVLNSSRLGEDGTASGPAEQLAEGIGDLEVSEEGSLLLIGEGTFPYSVVWSDRDGTITPAPDIPSVVFPLFSPDGSKLIGFADNIYIHDMERGVTSALLPDAAADAFPLFTPDGKEIIFGSNRDGTMNLYRTAADGSGEVHRLTTSERTQIPTSVTADGKTISYIEHSPETGWDTWLLTEGEAPRSVLVSPAVERGAISADGKWIVYQSDESGMDELYIRSVDGEGRWQLTSGGANHLTLKDGASGLEEIYYTLPGKLMVIPVHIEGDTVRAGRAEVLLTGAYPPINVNRWYAPAPDGRFLLRVRDPEADDSPQTVRLVQNWPALQSN